MMVFTAYRKANARVDVYYDPLAGRFSVRTDKGVQIKDSVSFKQYLEYVTTLNADDWRQLDFKSTAKLDAKFRS